MRNLILNSFLLLSATVGLAQNPVRPARSASRDSETNTPAKFVLEQNLPQGPSPLEIDKSVAATNTANRIMLEQRPPQELSPIQIRTPEAAIQVPDQAAAAVPGNQGKSAEVSFLIDAGVQYADEGEYVEAERAYARALESSPGNPDIRFRMGTLYIQMARYKDAVRMLESLVKEFPDSPMVQNNLAWVYATGGEVKNGQLALRYAREALLTVPFASSAWNTLAEAYYVSGEYDKALRSSETSIEMLRLEEGSEETMKGFETQRAKIMRANESSKMLLGLDQKD
jgi:tetratricopeptide (TPR) repeat protein